MVAAYRLAGRAVRLPAAPGRHRGRPDVPGHHQVGGRVRRAAGRGHRRHDPGVAVGAAGRGGQGRQRRSWSRWPARARPGDRVLPVAAGAPRSTSTRWPSRSPPASRAWTVPLRVAVMGCVVNGPGEAREADLGVASGNGKGQIFVKGEVIKTVPESQIVETLIEEALRLAEEMGVDASDRSAAVDVIAGAVAAGRRRLTAMLVLTSTAPDVSWANADLGDGCSTCWTRDPVRQRVHRVPGANAAAGAAWRLGGELWGYVTTADVCGRLCYSGANLVPAWLTTERSGRSPSDCPPARPTVLVDRGRRRPGRGSCGSCWSRPGVRRGSAASDQPLLDDRPDPAVARDPLVRAVRLDELDLLLPACIAMFTEEVGVSPLAHRRWRAVPRAGGRAGHRRAERSRGSRTDRSCSRPRSAPSRRRPARCRACGCDRSDAVTGLSTPGWPRWSRWRGPPWHRRSACT